MGIQVGGGDVRSFVNASLKDLGHQDTIRSSSKNEKLVSDLKKSATRN